MYIDGLVQGFGIPRALANEIQSSLFMAQSGLRIELINPWEI